MIGTNKETTFCLEKKIIKKHKLVQLRHWTAVQHIMYTPSFGVKKSMFNSRNNQTHGPSAGSLQSFSASSPFFERGWLTSTN